MVNFATVENSESGHGVHQIVEILNSERKAIMKITKLAMLIVTIAVVLFILVPSLSWAGDDAATLYKTKCAACHGADAAGKPAAKIPSLIGDEAKKAGDVLVKVILETCYLSPEQVAKACEIARDAGADYVKTSTGFGDGSATPETIDVMMKTVGDVMGVKASGGVHSYEIASGYLDQGCKRLGAASGTAVIMDEAPDEAAAGGE